jgi:hypothetical protein
VAGGGVVQPFSTTLSSFHAALARGTSRTTGTPHRRPQQPQATASHALWPRRETAFPLKQGARLRSSAPPASRRSYGCSLRPSRCSPQYMRLRPRIRRSPRMCNRGQSRPCMQHLHKPLGVTGTGLRCTALRPASWLSQAQRPCRAARLTLVSGKWSSSAYSWPGAAAAERGGSGHQPLRLPASPPRPRRHPILHYSGPAAPRPLRPPVLPAAP